MSEAIRLRQIEDKIITVRNKKVILDSDVAVLYGVETKRINEAESNNPDKFPYDYILEISSEEYKSFNFFEKNRKKFGN